MQQMLMASASSGAPAPPVVPTYVGVTAVGIITSDSTTVTGVSIGAAAANRMVFQFVHWKSSVSAPLASATIGGITAKIHVNNNAISGGGAYLGLALISALVPSGTTATVVLNFVTGSTYHDIRLETYNVTGLISDTPIATISSNPNSVASYSGTINVQKDGLLLFAATCYSANTAYTISGATQNYTQGMGTNYFGIGSSLPVAATQASRPVGITATGGFTFLASVVAASFR